MPRDPGWGPNGEWIAPDNPIDWEAAGPIVSVNEGSDPFIFFALGETDLPFYDPEGDDDIWTNPYMGEP